MARSVLDAEITRKIERTPTYGPRYGDAIKWLREAREALPEHLPAVKEIERLLSKIERIAA